MDNTVATRHVFAKHIIAVDTYHQLRPCVWQTHRQTTCQSSILSTSTVDLHTRRHPFNSHLSGTTRVNRYQKGETNLNFAEDSEWQWHQLGHMQVCTSLQTDNHASTPPLFLQAGCPSCRPSNSVKALKAVNSRFTQRIIAMPLMLVEREKKFSGSSVNCQRNATDQTDSLVTRSRPSCNILHLCYFIHRSAVNSRLLMRKYVHNRVTLPPATSGYFNENKEIHAQSRIIHDIKKTYILILYRVMKEKGH